MIQLCEGLSFASEPRESLRIIRERRGENLDGEREASPRGVN
jgi:hypothetical protein